MRFSSVYSDVKIEFRLRAIRIYFFRWERKNVPEQKQRLITKPRKHQQKIQLQYLSIHWCLNLLKLSIYISSIKSISIFYWMAIRNFSSLEDVIKWSTEIVSIEIAANIVEENLKESFFNFIPMKISFSRFLLIKISAFFLKLYFYNKVN